MSWRDRCKHIIEETIREVTERCSGPYTEDERRAVRKALKPKYPFCERQYHPYKIWLDEIKRQLGELPALGARRPAKPNPDQCELFTQEERDGE